MFVVEVMDVVRGAQAGGHAGTACSVHEGGEQRQGQRQLPAGAPTKACPAPGRTARVPTLTPKQQQLQPGAEGLGGGPHDLRQFHPT